MDPATIVLLKEVGLPLILQLVGAIRSARNQNDKVTAEQVAAALHLVEELIAQHIAQHPDDSVAHSAMGLVAKALDVIAKDETAIEAGLAIFEKITEAVRLRLASGNWAPNADVAEVMAKYRLDHPATGGQK